MPLIILVSLALGMQRPSRGLIASVDSIGIPVEHAVNLLKLKGIRASAMGSRAYGIFVDKKDEARASKVLSVDAATHPYDYLQIAGYKGKLGLPDESKWPLRQFSVDLDKVDSDPEFRRDGNLRGLARESAEQMADLFPRIKNVTYFIKEMRLFTMEYMAADGHLENGYKAHVTIGYRGQSGTADYWMYSWNKGRNHECRGGSASTPDNSQ
jgi:hypothetical protein